MAIMAARAAKRGEQAAAQRRVQRTPELWGVSAEILHLPTSRDVEVVRESNRHRILAAKRSDPFDLLLAAGGLTEDQHRAARRLFRDWCLRAGVKDHDQRVLERVDGGRADPSSVFTDSMIDAGERVARALKGDPRLGVSGVGPVNARLLEALISPMVDEGRLIAWRGVVERVTGETERHVQGAMVRQACEALHLVYEALAEIRRRERELETLLHGPEAAA